jgi:hypothetical protein
MHRRLLLACAPLLALVVPLCAYLLWPRDPLAWLEAMPGGVVQRVVCPQRPNGTIVHILDCHPGSGRQLADDLHLEDVERAQEEQVTLLGRPAHGGYRTVGVEGLTSSGLKAWELKLSAIRNRANDSEHVRHMMLEAKRIPGDKEAEIARSAEALARRQRVEIAGLGAVARYQLCGEEVGLRVFGLDDEQALEEATPRKGKGGWVFDEGKLEARQQAIVRNSVATGSGSW